LRSARGGTVFLDEVGELTPQVQAKVLRALEVREIQPVGGDRPLKVDFRLVAATNQPLEDLVANGSFRRDLFFRLNVFRIDVPPLRERRQDIPALAQHFLSMHCRAVGKRIARLSNDAMRLLLAYGWPGNVRELSNVIERAVLLADEEAITPNDLPAEIRGLPPGRSRSTGDGAVRAQHISRVLARSTVTRSGRQSFSASTWRHSTATWRDRARLNPTAFLGRMPANREQGRLRGSATQPSWADSGNRNVP